MNQKLREQVQKLEEAFAGKGQEGQLNTSTTTVPNTPSSIDTQAICRGRSPVSLRFHDKENHVLTPKSRFIPFPNDFREPIQPAELDSLFVDFPQGRKHPKSKIRLAY